MGRTFIFRDMDYYYSKFWKNDPNLQSIEDYFENNGVDFEKINWSERVKLIDHGSTGSYHIDDCIKKVDFSSFSQSERSIVLNGSGKYHHRTFFLVKNSSSVELSYVQLDAHTDFGTWGVCNDFVNSGGFVENIVDLKKIKKVYLLGLVPTEIIASLGHNEGMGPNKKFILVDNPPIFNKKTELYLHDNYVLNPEELSDIEFKSLIKYQEKYKSLMRFSPSLIPTEDVYVSIDLDVIGEFPTSFRRLGKLSLENVLELISSIGKTKNIVGADICGLDLNQLSYEEGDKKSIYLKQIYTIYQTLKSFMKSEIYTAQSQSPHLHLSP
ncbi:MAG: hypothetical protein KAK00_10845 [Nanoarchaeota archaeon]|nr:hypothetical protein [Nanoarchaeota archaeon]